MFSLFDPFGSEALDYYTKYWTVFEKNENLLPFEGAILYNRLIWLTISISIFLLIYRSFSFTQTSFSFRKNRKEERSVKNNFGGITRIKLPEISFDFSLKERLKTAWDLSNWDLKFIVKNWIFLVVIALGLVFAFITISFLGMVFGTKTYPVTWQMLEISGGVFSSFINLMTFLFSGLLLHRGRNTRMNHLIDTTPTPNWVIFLSKFLALVKMQIILLFIIMFTGIVYQIVNGFFDFEIGHYFTELYGIRLIHCIIWALLAVFIQTLFKNYLLGFFTLLILSIGMTFLPMFGVQQTIFIFNKDSGFSYSDMNGYGHDLALYFIYKLYWLLLGILFFVLSLLFYVRGVSQSVKGRFVDAKQRLNSKILIYLLKI